MSPPIASDHVQIEAPPSSITPRRIAVVRAGAALLWAVALVVAVGDEVPTTASDLPVAAALVLTTYPLIDVVASVLGASLGGAADRGLRVNAAISTVAAVAIGVNAFGADAGATLVAFGAWAAVSGVMLLRTAAVRRRAEGGQVPLLLSGGISTLAGLSFISRSGSDDADVSLLGGYMAGGAILFLLSARRGPRASS